MRGFEVSNGEIKKLTDSPTNHHSKRMSNVNANNSSHGNIYENKHESKHFSSAVISARYNALTADNDKYTDGINRSFTSNSTHSQHSSFNDKLDDNGNNIGNNSIFEYNVSFYSPKLGLQIGQGRLEFTCSNRRWGER